MPDRPHDRPEVSHSADLPTRDAHDDGRVWVPWSEIELPDEPSYPDAHGDTAEHPDDADEPGESDASEPDEPPTGWDAPELADHPDRPDPESIHLTAERRIHILDGDGTGGGHRYGTGRPRKSEFPEDWNDERIVTNILDVARNPDEPPIQQWNDRWICRGTRDQVVMDVAVQPDGRVWTTYPEPGGPGVRLNPPADQ